MYNVNFVNNIYEDKLVFVFHNEKNDVEKNIVIPMEKALKPLLKEKYFDRASEECLISLRYPNPDSSKSDFAYFFDSPFCAAFHHKEYKGVFIIDASNYVDAIGKPITELGQYIKENISEDFCFICLFNHSVKRTVEKILKNIGLDNRCFVDLELDDDTVKEFCKKIESSTYDKLNQRLNDPTLRTKSYSYVNNIITHVLSKKVSEDAAIAKLTFEDSEDKERRIGF